MALTALQRDVCRLLAARRRAGGESYVAGGVALNVALEAHRMSRDLDVFHDTTEAVARSWDRDRVALEHAGYGVSVVRERPGFVEATVSRPGQSLIVEWARDSAFRFFPLVEHDELGLTLHPFDLATNKILALAGRREARDWVDAITCDERLQPLGYLAWAACGKDPGFTPPGLVAHVQRVRFSDAEMAALAFVGPPPTAADLSRRWHAALETARAIVEALPANEAGTAALSLDGHLYRGNAADVIRDLKAARLQFHAGRIGGAFPQARG
jgi:hypothetical protein